MWGHRHLPGRAEPAQRVRLLRILEDGFGLSTQPATSCFPTLCPTAPSAINEIWHTGP
jgi:hypothetical protein